MTNTAKYIFEDDPLKQREYINAAYAKVMARGGGVVISEKTLTKYRGIYNDPKIKLAHVIKKYYGNKLRNKIVKVEIKGDVIKVGFGADGQKKAMNGRLTAERASTYEHLEKLLETGNYAYSQNNRKTETDKTYAKYVPYFHYFINNVNIDGVDVPVKIQVREMDLQSGIEYKYYTHDIVKKTGGAPAPV